MRTGPTGEREQRASLVPRSTNCESKMKIQGDPNEATSRAKSRIGHRSGIFPKVVSLTQRLDVFGRQIEVPGRASRRNFDCKIPDVGDHLVVGWRSVIDRDANEHRAERW